MRYHPVALAAMPMFAILASAADSVPSGALHQDKWGNQIIQNHCDMPVYYVFDNQLSTSTIAPSATMSVPIYTKTADGGGGSTKLFTKKDTDLYAKPAQPVTQFEITPSDLQYFDISNVNSNIGDGMNGNGEPCEGYPPFMAGGMSAFAKGVDTVSCAPGSNPCKSSYSKNDDNFATTASEIGTDITLVLCPSGGGSGSSGGSGSGSSGGSGSGSSGGSGSGTSGGSGSGTSGEGNQSQGGSSSPPPITTPSSTPPSSTPPTPTTTSQAVNKPAVEEKVAKNKENVDDSDSNDSDSNIVWVYETVTAPVETITAGASHQKEKRHEHIHQHVHNKINKRRHGGA